VGSGYASVIALSLFSLVSIPFAIRYLGREGFGVAATIVQIAAFSQILQLGVGPSVARFIVDYQHLSDAKKLGSFVKTAFAIGAIQGVVLLGLAFVVTGWLGAAFSVPTGIRDTFENVTVLSLCAAALGLFLNPTQQLLYASQRIDLINYIGIVAQGTATLALVGGLITGFGLYSYAVGAWVGSLSGAGLSLLLTRKLGVLPRMGGLPFDWHALPSLLRFSSNVMMVTFGLQLIAIAPAVVINRLLGAAAMGDWTVGTRLLQLGMQLTSRISNATEPMLWEIYAGGNRQWVSERLKQTLQIAASAAAILGGCLLALNGNFVLLWSSGKVTWNWLYDCLGGCLLIASAVAATWCMLPGITKRLGIIRYTYPAEGIGILALLCMPSFVTSPLGVLLGALVSMVAFRVGYGAFRAARDLQQSIGALIRTVARPLLLCLAICPVALWVRYMLQYNQTWHVLTLMALCCLSLFLGFAYVVGIGGAAKTEARRALTRMINEAKTGCKTLYDKHRTPGPH
jgi:O-antigen/teichoic acid export membrane protein